jgi:serine/threonine protein kinase
MTMSKKIIIDDFYEYEIEDVKEGGMGKVLILNRLSPSDKFHDALVDNSEFANHSSFVYRKKLAAKTFKDGDFVEKNKTLFERELNIWINIDSANVAKLLKVVFIERNLFAIMPYYNSSLREIIEKRVKIEIEDVKLIILNIIKGLHETIKKYRIVHQDLKPENVLVDFRKDKVYFFISDWGIANVQKIYCHEMPSNNYVPVSFVESMTGMGTLLYMGPERFIEYRSSVTADIYSLGMIFFELLFGYLPFDYNSRESLVSQIMNFRYFYKAEDLLKKNFSDKISNTILKCIHPDIKKRYANYEKLTLDVYNINIKRNFFFF